VQTTPSGPAGAPDDPLDSTATIARLRQAVAQVVVGNEVALEQLLTALLCRGHALLEDVPGARCVDPTTWTMSCAGLLA
jgi:MoxR-like ATPase